MFRLTKDFRFEASHQLLRHDGKCARLHGHSWRGWLTAKGADLVTSGPKENMLVDYGDLGKAAKFLEAILDHYHLNDVLLTDMPTSEFVARWAFEKVREAFPDLPIASVGISETCTSSCEYRP